MKMDFLKYRAQMQIAVGTKIIGALILVLATGGLAKTTIVTEGDEVPAKVRLAAAEVRRYLYLRTGELPDTASQLPRRGEVVMLAGNDSGSAAALLPASVRELVARLEPGQYRLETVIDRNRRVVCILGGDDLGVLHGGYRFCEALGVRFYLHGDTIPDERWRGPLAVLNETGRPLFAVRGVNPWGSHPFGFDAWGADEYKAIFGQLAKMRMNFLGLHCYPEGSPYAEPTVWHGLPGDFDEQGRVKESYVSHYYNTLIRGHWGPIQAKKTSDFSWGGAGLFEDDAWAPAAMKDLGPQPRTAQECNELFNRTAAQFREAFGFARQMGIKTCLGTEAPLTLPKALRDRLTSQGRGTNDPAVVREVYEATFRRIMASHPLDYYWLWMPEGWAWFGNKPEDYRATVRDLELAQEALRKVGAPFRLATCGWVLGPKNDRAALDADLPKEVAMSALSQDMGLVVVDPAFGRIRDRETWAIPWLESDSFNALAAVQLSVRRMRRDAADALARGCTGLLGLHWRTEILAPNVSALAQATWDQSPWNPNPGQLLPDQETSTDGPIGGHIASYPGREIANTDDDFLYQSCRYSFEGYNLKAPNGRYRVMLKFMEPRYDAPGGRVFDLKIQDRVVVDGLDVAVRVGKFSALDLTFDDVTVTNGWLRIGLVAREWVANVYALVVEGENFTRKINCGGPAYRDYEADDVALEDTRRYPAAADFYADWAQANFGGEAAPDIARLFERLDGRVPGSVESACPSGNLSPDLRPWSVVAERFAFVDELAGMRPRVKGAGNLARFDYWIESFRYHRALARVRCALGEFESAMKWAEAETNKNRRATLAETLALPRYRELLETFGETYRHLLATVNSPGALATVVNLENHSRFRPAVIDKTGERLAKCLGKPLPADLVPPKQYQGEPRLIVPTVRSHAARGEALNVTVIALDRQPVRSVTLHWRKLGTGAFRSQQASHLGRAVFQATFPPAEADLEYYLTAQTASGKKLRWPATAPDLCQTVVVLP